MDTCKQVIGRVMGIPIVLNDQLPPDGWFLKGEAVQVVSKANELRWVVPVSNGQIMRLFDALTYQDVSDEFLSEEG